MTRLKASFFLILLWAAVYLPGLGSTEIKGEEGRRILPAVTMLETGNWLVPYVGGEPFLRKPPLVNWMIAGAFRVTGLRNEWTARLPAAMCVLALGLAIVCSSGPGWLGVETAFAAAILAMTQMGLLAKARFAGAELEGIYGPISGLAMILWLALRARGFSRWVYWPVAGVFLGLASLAKGPSFHLLFFYLVALTVIWNEARGSGSPWRFFLRSVLHPAHFLSILVAAGIFAAWAVPYFGTSEAKGAAAIWRRQGIERFTDAEITASTYGMNLPRALVDELPWLLLVPAFFRRVRPGFRSGKRVAPFEGETTLPFEDCEGAAVPWAHLAAVTGATAFVILIIPGALPRYILPLGPIFALALAWAAAPQEGVLRRWHLVNRILAGVVILAALAAPLVAGYPLGESSSFDLGSALGAGLASTLSLAGCAFILARRSHLLKISHVAGASGALLGAAMLLYAGAAVKWINRSDDLRPAAAIVNAMVPPGERLAIFDPGYLASIFYLRGPYFYALELGEIPADVSWVLVREKERAKFARKMPAFTEVQRLGPEKGQMFLLLHRRAEIQKLPAR